MNGSNLDVEFKRIISSYEDVFEFFSCEKLILIEKNSENNFKKKELFDVKFVPLLNNNNGN